MRPTLAKHGLGITQFLWSDETHNYLDTKVFHSSGEAITGTCLLPIPQGASCQEAGSVIQYFRRYAINAALNLAAEDDDDANVADGNDMQRKAPPQKPAAKPPAKKAPAKAEPPWMRVLADEKALQKEIKANKITKGALDQLWREYGSEDDAFLAAVEGLIVERKEGGKHEPA